ncbi:MAG: PDZ domain-containing protein, partial [Planctomycetota bacterium]
VGGDSSGPLFDLEGRVIGIHSSIGESTEQNHHVPIDVYHANWKRFMDKETWGQQQGQNERRPAPRAGGGFLGVILDNADYGALVRDIVLESSADKAGLVVGDVILEIDGKKTADREVLIGIVRVKEAGSKIKLKVVRNGKPIDVDVELGKRPEGELKNKPRPLPLPKALIEEAKKNEGKLNLSLERLAKIVRSQLDRNAADKKEIDLGRWLPDDLIEETKKSKKDVEIKPEDVVGLIRRAARSRQRRRGRSNQNEKDDNYVVETITKNLENVKPSILRVFAGDKQVAVATAVDKDGLVMTKASEVTTTKDKIECELPGGKRVSATVLGHDKKHDLALLRVEAALQPVSWRDELPPLGSYLAAMTPGARRPASGGVLSVKPRAIRRGDPPLLGVMPTPTDDGRVKIEEVVDGSGAKSAGVKAGDIVLKLGKKKITSVDELIGTIQQYAVGDEIVLSVLRGKKTLEIKAKLGKNPSAQQNGRAQRMNRMGATLSSRRGGFPSALQHDLELRPQDCGSPLFDLSGRALGINIARGGRIKSYAIPTKIVKSVLTSLAGSELVAKQDAAKSRAALEAATKLVGDVRAKRDRLLAEAEKARKAFEAAQAQATAAESELDGALKKEAEAKRAAKPLVREF